MKELVLRNVLKKHFQKTRPLYVPSLKIVYAKCDRFSGFLPKNAIVQQVCHVERFGLHGCNQTIPYIIGIPRAGTAHS